MSCWAVLILGATLINELVGMPETPELTVTNLKVQRLAFNAISPNGRTAGRVLNNPQPQFSAAAYLNPGVPQAVQIRPAWRTLQEFSSPPTSALRLCNLNTGGDGLVNTHRSASPFPAARGPSAGQRLRSPRTDHQAYSSMRK